MPIKFGSTEYNGKYLVCKRCGYRWEPNSDELTEIKDSLVDIAADGVISEDEKPELKEILAYLDELTKTISELRSIGIKVLNGGTEDGGA